MIRDNINLSSRIIVFPVPVTPPRHGNINNNWDTIFTVPK